MVKIRRQSARNDVQFGYKNKTRFKKNNLRSKGHGRVKGEKQSFNAFLARDVCRDGSGQRVLPSSTRFRSELVDHEDGNDEFSRVFTSWQFLPTFSFICFVVLPRSLLLFFFFFTHFYSLF